ncbi:hypothetical protein CKO_00846 [Citrobacter koseri ATCC BAA-895]|uniref:Uncharacterized protein n=1 Tax=Citrobacter koseri (strain ATCC BAA-895 / CDC 4225-83 / SGSC4696) TaxID=290338 RepID=A8AET3_CITK8|nr:hypothetical protein CKO_00846 [Citrobacter koseri ATCC BAA-895]
MVMLKGSLILLKYLPTDNYQKVHSWHKPAPLPKKPTFSGFLVFSIQG